MHALATPRLQLRRWRADDAAPFAAINADPAVMQHLVGPLGRALSDTLMARIEAHFDAHGFGLWAVERRVEGDLVGFVGAQHVPFEADFTPAVEIGWRLAAPVWGQGYAREAAEATLRDLRRRIGISAVVSFTVPANRPSWGLMQRLGLRRDAAGDFAHPRLPVDHPLSLHWLYRARLDEAGRPC
jgi:RimJ/RimL family protein N-acetyltransferase